MGNIWSRFAVTFVLSALLCAALGAIFNWTAACALALVLMLVQTGVNTYHAQRLARLLKAPVYGEVPRVGGLWGEIYYRLHKLGKQWHAQVRHVEQQHARFIQAIQASPNGVMMLDERDQIEWCNTISEVHFGIDAKRDVRQPVTHLVRQPEFVRYLRMRRFDETLTMRGMGRTRQNVVAVQAFPYGDNRKLLLTQDITELERADQMRRDFVANVSHELKTPLTVLSGFLETLRELPVSDDERKSYLELMEQQSSRMRSIVNDLLVLAKLEGSARPPEDAVVDMRAIFNHLRADAATLSRGRHRIAFSCDETLSVIGSSTEIFSAFGNLVINAVRYTPEGGQIDVTWQREGSRADFAVRDSGLGIPATDLPRLTERFYRVDRSRSRDTGGTGLGLAITKHVLQRHDAQLLIESEEGQGSLFIARFPSQRVVSVADAA